MFLCEYCEIFKNIYFEEHLSTAASNISKQSFWVLQEWGIYKIRWKKLFSLQKELSWKFLLTWNPFFAERLMMHFASLNILR